MRYRTSVLVLGGLVGVTGILGACADETTSSTSDPPVQCLESALPYQNARAFTLGETFYLPNALPNEGCPAEAKWSVTSQPEGSTNVVYNTGSPNPRFTPDAPGDYVFQLEDLGGAEVTLKVVSRDPADRFRNHYLTPLFGAAAVGDDVWTANGASYTVTRLVPDGQQGLKKDIEVPVGAWPAAVASLPDMPHVLVAHRGSDSLGFLDKARGTLEDALWVGDEPVGIAIAPDGSRAYVTLATERRVAVVDLASREIVGHINVGFDPRAVAVSPDGAWLFAASYRSGNPAKDIYGTYGEDDDQDVWIARTDTLAVEKTIHGISADLRALALSDDGKELFLTATDGDPIPPQTQENAKPFIHEVIVIDADSASATFGEVLRRADLTRQDGSGGPLVNPGGVLATPDTVWVTGESSDQVVGLDPVTLAEKFRADIGEGARKIVPFGADGSVAVHCYRSFEIWIVGPDGSVKQTISVAKDPRPADVALGEQVFYRPGGAIRNNHACASCHIETQTDGQNWRFGPTIWHNVRPLNLLGATTPIEWGAYVSSAENFGYQGPASIMGLPATPEEAKGLQAFLSSLLGAAAGTSTTRPDGSFSEAALRGKAVFEGKGTCFSCHTPPLYTNRTLIKKGKSGVEADVPTLLGAYRHGVYFVKGGARDLNDAVDVAIDYLGVDLTSDEKADLLTFLGELTTKQVAPLGFWPDIDTGESVYTDIQPWVLFSEPVDDTQPDATAEELAAKYVLLLDDAGKEVPSQVVLEGGKITRIPDAPLASGAKYKLLVKEGLPFRSGGVWWGDYEAPFQTANPPDGELVGEQTMTIETSNSQGPVTIVLDLTPIEASPGGLAYVIAPLTFSDQQRQDLWLRIDGSKVLIEPFALPVSETGVGDGREVRGSIVDLDQNTGEILRIEGTLTIGAPGFDKPDVPFSIVPKN